MTLNRIFAWAMGVVLVIAGAGCDRDSKQQAAPAPAAASGGGGGASPQGAGGKPAEDLGGAIAHPGGTMERPAGSGVRSFTPATPAMPNDRALARVSDAFALASDRALFAKPVTVTLKLDKSKLPPDLRPEAVYPVLAWRGMTEQLYDGVKVDLVGGTVSYELKRRYPLVASQPGPGAPATQPANPDDAVTTFIVMGTTKLNQLGTATDPPIYVTNAHTADSAGLATTVRQVLDSARGKLEAMGYPRVAGFRIVITDLVGNHAGEASGGVQIAINHNTLVTTPGFTASLVAHEYFHLVQQTLLKDGWAKLGMPENASTPGEARWVDEGTADAIEYPVCGVTPVAALSRLKLTYAYRPLNAYDAAAAGSDIHEYQAAAFFLYAMAKHGNLQPAIAQFYQRLMTGGVAVAPLPPSAVPEPGSLEEIGFQADFEDKYKLDSYKSMDAALRDQCRKSLRRLYLESLMALYYRKDVEPFKSGVPAEFGAPMRIMVPDAKLVKMVCPFRVGDSWRSDNDSPAMTGEGMCIINAVEVTRTALPTDASANGSKSLQLTVTAPGATGNDLVLVAFNTDALGNVKGPHAVGNLTRPAILADFDAVPKAIVWVINLTPGKLDNVVVKANMVAGSDVRIAYADKMDRDRVDGNRLVVSSGALAALNATDKLNGLRFKLYRSMKREGPWDAVTSNFLDSNVQEDIFKGEARSKNQLIAPDKAALFDPNVYRRGQTVQAGPFFYRVGQTMLLNRNGIQTTGAETLSNILGPGKGIVRLLPQPGGAGPFEVDRDWCTFTALLSAENQNWDCAGAEFTVKVGKWTGHFYSGRVDSDLTIYGIADPDRRAIGYAARIRVPYRPQGTEMTIEATGADGAITATLTMDIPKDEKAAQREAQMMTAYEKAKTAWAAACAKDAGEARKARDAAKNGLAEYEDAVRNKKLVFGTRWQNRSGLLDRELDLKRIETERVPFTDVDAFEQARDSATTVDPQFELAHLRKVAQRADAMDASKVEGAKAQVALLNELIGSEPDKKVQDQMRQRLAFEQKNLADAQAQPPTSRYSTIQMARPAERLGDAAVARQALELSLAESDREIAAATPQELDIRKSDKVAKLRKMSETLVMLTGNRTESAALWRQADQLAGIKENPADKKKRYLPAWFLSGK